MHTRLSATYDQHLRSLSNKATKSMPSSCNYYNIQEIKDSYISAVQKHYLILVNVKGEPIEIVCVNIVKGILRLRLLLTNIL